MPTVQDLIFFVCLSVYFSGGFCQSPPLRWSWSGLPLQHAVCVPSVSSDLQTGQDPGGVPNRSLTTGDGPAGTDRPRAQYPTNVKLILCFYWPRIFSKNQQFPKIFKVFFSCFFNFELIN